MFKHYLNIIYKLNKCFYKVKFPKIVEDNKKQSIQRGKNIMKNILEYQKKAIMGQVISVFVLVLVISILAGLTFLFVSELKTQVQNTATGGTASTAYQVVNDTEAAGATVVNYLPLIFLALIFGAILTLVLKIILAYINLGQTMGGF